MEVVICRSPQEVAARAATAVVELAGATPKPVLGLPTGATPVRLYRELVNHFRAGRVSFTHAITFNLDEYVGLDAGHERSYRRFMDEHLFRHVDIRPENTHFPECPAGADPDTVGESYERKIRAAGGIDLQLLGIGRNGHIGFNEPTSSLQSRTRIKTLAESTVRSNAGRQAAPGDQPRLAVTAGIGTILDARKIVLMATGESKADAVRDFIEGPVSAMCPASALQLHRHAAALVDEAAASKLQLADYYRWVARERRNLEARRPAGGTA